MIQLINDSNQDLDINSLGFMICLDQLDQLEIRAIFKFSF